MIVAVIIGIAALIGLVTTTVLVAVTFRQALSDAFRALESNELRNQKQLDTVLDRLMVIKWEDLIAVRAVEADEDGGFITPEDQKESEVVVDDGSWGHLSTLRKRLDLLDNERELIDEDFDEEGSPRRADNV